jgi:hypothetical protein
MFSRDETFLFANGIDHKWSLLAKAAFEIE